MRGVKKNRPFRLHRTLPDLFVTARRPAKTAGQRVGRRERTRYRGGVFPLPSARRGERPLRDRRGGRAKDAKLALEDSAPRERDLCDRGRSVRRFPAQTPHPVRVRSAITPINTLCRGRRRRPVLLSRPAVAVGNEFILRARPGGARGIPIGIDYDKGTVSYNNIQKDGEEETRKE